MSERRLYPSDDAERIAEAIEAMTEAIKDATAELRATAELIRERTERPAPDVEVTSC